MGEKIDETTFLDKMKFINARTRELVKNKYPIRVLYQSLFFLGVLLFFGGLAGGFVFMKNSLNYYSSEDYMKGTQDAREWGKKNLD